MRIGRLLAMCKREEQLEDNRGKVCLANGEKYVIKHSQTLRVRDVCIEIAKQLNIAPVALDFFTLMTTDCEHCLKPNRQMNLECTKANDHYLSPKRVLHADECASKVFYFRLAFKAIPGPDIKMVDQGAFEYFVEQCRWDYLNGRITGLTKKDHLTLLVLECIIRAHENDVSGKDVLDNPKKYGLLHMFQDNDFSVREIRNHLKKQISQFKTCQENIDKAKNSLLYVLESVEDFGITKIVVNKFYYHNVTNEVHPVEWEILISANGLKKRRTYKDEGDFETDRGQPFSSKDEIISDYKDIEYLEIKQSESNEIIHISRMQGFLEVISVGKSMTKKESLITLIEGFYRLLVNQYKTLTKYEPGLELPMPSIPRKEFEIHGPIERKKAEALLKAVDCQNGDRSGVHLIRRSRQKFDSYNLSFICVNEVRHYVVVKSGSGQFGIENGPSFESLGELLEFYKTAQRGFPSTLTKYCPIPREGLCALFDEQIVVEPPHPPSSSRPVNPEYQFVQIGNMQLQKLNHSFTSGNFADRYFKARWLKGDNSGCQEVFCRRLVPSRSPNFKDKVIRCAEKMCGLVHRNLVQFHGVCFFNDQNTYLALEWISSGTLDDYLIKEVDVTVDTLITFAAQISEACMYLHNSNYVHGWLAAHNVLVVNEEQVKISDVSIPCLREEELLQTSELNRSPWKARECFLGRPYSKESDVWAFGVVLWEMFTKTKPFQNMSDEMIIQVFQQERHLACPKCCPEEVGKIMKSCWITEPSRRPSFASIVMKLRSILDTLTPQEKQRKIPQTIDENFTIEPLMVNKQPSPVFRVEDETPFTSSLQSTDGETAGATAFELPSKDSQEPYVSSSSDDRELDFIPEKESREMIWSPEEIELKRIQRKYPRTLSLEERGESTYDRIEHRDEDIQVEMSDETLETIKIERSDLAPYGGDISTENELLDDRVSPETDKQLNEGYFSISNLNHVGFLACQLGQGDTSGDRRHNGTIEEDSEPLDEGTVDGEFSYSETSLIQNLDPFAPDSEKRTALMFANLEQGTSQVGNREPTSGNQSVKQSHPFTSAPSSTQPGHRIGKTSTNAKKHGNSYGYVKSPDSWKSEGINRTKFPGYVKTTSLSSRAGSGTLSSSRGTLAPSSESLPEFSKLDPFASSAEKFEISDNFNPRSSSPGMGNERAMRPLLQRSKPAQTVQNLFFNIKKQPQSSYQKLNSGSNYGSLSGKAGKEEQRPLLSEFSSFLVRDPFSEILTNDQSQSTDSSSSSYGAEELSYREKVAQTATTGISTNKTYGAQNILRNSSTPVSEKLKQLEQVRTSTTPSGVAPSLRKSSKSFPNPCLSRTGYVPVPGRSTSINQTVVATAPDRNTTSQASKFKSQDNVAPNHLPAFSDRDPFSEMLPQKCEVNEGRSSVGAFVKVRGNEAMNKSKVGLQGQLPDHSVQAFRHPLKDRSQATPALKKQNYVRVAGRNGHQRNMASPTHLVDKYECDPTKPSPTCSVDSRIDSISDCDIMSDILQSWDKADGNGKESSDMFPNLTYAELMTSNSKSTSSRVTQSTKTGPRESSHYRSSTSNYASFTNENKLSEKPKSSTQAVPLPQSSIDIVEGFKDMDPFKETRTTQALRADSKSEDQPAVVYSSICTTSPSELRSRNSPVDPVGDGRAEEEEKRTEIKMGVDSSEMLPGVSFGNRDPFAEIIPSKTTLINKSPEECLGEERIHLARTNERSENALEGLAEDVGESISSACTENDTISNFVNTRADLLSGSGYQSVKSNAGEKQPTGVQSSTFDSTSNVTEKRSVSNELRPRLEETTNIVPLSSTDNGGRQRPPDKDKQLTRKVSDIDSAYAKVKIVNAGTTSYQKVVNSSETADESVLGAVGREELVTEVDQERDTGPAPEDKEETVVDPFNIPAAAESIQNLDPSWPESLPEKKTEAFEESMKSHVIPYSSLSFNDKERDLGRGAFGVVRKAKLTRVAQHKTRISTDVAVKCLREGASEIYKNSFKQEAINLMKLDNKFIVKFLGISYDDNKKLLLVTELVPQGSLDSYLKDQKNLRILGNEVLLQFAIQITMGMQYLESKKLVHRDLAARNILVATESHVKISDFGLSRIYDDEYYRSHRENQKLPIRWLAPECLEQKKFTVYSDVWSLGVTLWEMFSYGKRPYDDMTFKNASELIDYLKKGNQLQKPSGCPEEVYCHIKECWCLTPSRRISFFLLKMFLEEILRDKYSKRPYFM